MRFLIDQCLSPALATLLRDAGHDALHVRDRRMHQATDSEILSFAESESRILVSADSDFGEILTIGTKRNLSLILFRGEFDPRSQEQASSLIGALPELLNYLEKGSIVVITRSRARVREL